MIMSVLERLNDTSSEEKPNTMDVIWVRIDKDTVIPITEFFQRKELQGFTKRVQQDLERLYKLNEKHNLFHFPEFEKDNPLTIDCYSATKDSCTAHYRPSNHVVEFVDCIVEGQLQMDLLGTLAHELRHAEQDIPQIRQFAKNKFQERQVGFIMETDSFALERKALYLDGKGDSEYLAIVKKCTDSEGKLDEKKLDSIILEKELNALLTEGTHRNSFYRSRYDRYYLVLDDNLPGITHIPPEFHFPETDGLYRMIQNVPKDPLTNDLRIFKTAYIQLEKVKKDIAFLREHVDTIATIFSEEGLGKPKNYAHTNYQDVINTLFQNGLGKEDKDTDLFLLKAILEAKVRDGSPLVSDVNFQYRRNYQEMDKISKEKYLKKKDGTYISPLELIEEACTGGKRGRTASISRAEFVEILADNIDPDHRNKGKSLADIALNSDNSEALLTTPVSDTYRTEINDKFETVSKTGYKDDRVTEYSRYYEGKKTDATYIPTPSDEENLTEWIVSERWLYPEIHGESLYTRCIFNKKDGTTKTLIYSNEENGKLGKFLHGIITDTEGKSQRCDAKGKILTPIQKFISDKLPFLRR